MPAIRLVFIAMGLEIAVGTWLTTEIAKSDAANDADDRAAIGDMRRAGLLLAALMVLLGVLL